MLRFDAAGFGHVCFPQSPRLKVRELLSRRLQLTQDKNSIGLTEDGDFSKWVQPKIESPIYCKWHMDQGANEQAFDLKVWPMQWMVRGCQLWFEVLPMLAVVHHEPDLEAMAKPLLDSWKRFEKWQPAGIPLELLMHRCIDRRKVHCEWWRFLPEHSMSTTGVLFVFSKWAARSRQRGKFSSEGIQDLLHMFLRSQLSEVSLHIPVVLDKQSSLAFCNLGVAPPSQISTLVLVDKGLIDCTPLLDNDDLQLQVRSRIFFRDVCGQMGWDLEEVPIAGLLCELAKVNDLEWLLRNITLMLGIFFESLFLQKEKNNNPVGFDTAIGRRRDRTLADHLVLGRGGDCSDHRAVFIEQHARTYLALKRGTKDRPPREKAARLNVERVRADQLLRYMHQAREFFKGCHHLAMSIDGTRIGRHELNAVILTGTNLAGETLAAWCPPQAVCTKSPPPSPPPPPLNKKNWEATIAF